MATGERWIKAILGTDLEVAGLLVLRREAADEVQPARRENANGTGQHDQSSVKARSESAQSCAEKNARISQAANDQNERASRAERPPERTSCKQECRRGGIVLALAGVGLDAVQAERAALCEHKGNDTQSQQQSKRAHKRSGTEKGAGRVG